MPTKVCDDKEGKYDDTGEKVDWGLGLCGELPKKGR